MFLSKPFCKLPELLRKAEPLSTTRSQTSPDVSHCDFNYAGKHNADRRQLDKSVFGSDLHIFELPNPGPCCGT